MRKLLPEMTGSLRRIVRRPDELFEAISTYGSPISAVDPRHVHDKVSQFEAVLKACGLTHRIFAAHKATNSRAIVSALKGRTGIDVASVSELHGALRSGFLAKDIIATGPKNDIFLQELHLTGATIVVDSPEELERLGGMLPQKKLSILLRLTRTMLNGATVTKQSRFGMDKDGYQRAVNYLALHSGLQLKGIAFHLDSQSTVERVVAIGRAIDYLLELQQQFPSATVIDIGGGYGADYGVSFQQVQQFEEDLRRAVQSGDHSLTWKGYNYGLRSVNGMVKGSLRGVDAPTEHTGVARLDDTLRYIGGDGKTVAHLLEEHLIDIWIEPGSSLFYDSGFVAAEVIEVRLLDGSWMVLVDAHRNQVSFEGNEALADPLLISRHETKSEKPFLCYVVGHLCAEGDFMNYRSIEFERIPVPGDIVLWTHAGAYRSHFSASSAIGHRLSTQLVYKESGENYHLVKEIT